MIQCDREPSVLYKACWIEFDNPYCEFPYYIMKLRAKDRISKFKEELVMKAWHPDRVQKWLDSGMDIEDC